MKRRSVSDPPCLLIHLPARGYSSGQPNPRMADSVLLRTGVKGTIQKFSNRMPRLVEAITFDGLHFGAKFSQIVWYILVFFCGSSSFDLEFHFQGYMCENEHHICAPHAPIDQICNFEKHWQKVADPDAGVDANINWRLLYKRAMSQLHEPLSSAPDVCPQPWTVVFSRHVPSKSKVTQLQL